MLFLSWVRTNWSLSNTDRRISSASFYYSLNYFSCSFFSLFSSAFFFRLIRKLLSLFRTGLFLSSGIARVARRVSYCSTGTPNCAAFYSKSYNFLSWAALSFSIFCSSCLCFFSSNFCNFPSFFCLAFSSFNYFLSLTFILPVSYYWDSCY